MFLKVFYLQIDVFNIYGLLPSFRWYSMCLPTEGWPGWVHLGDWLHTRMVYPPVDDHPSKY